MKELDLLKKDWKKNENSFEQISEKEIYKMIHKKSSSIVKWILIISILEVIFWISVGILSNSDEYLLKINHPEIMTYLKIFDVFNYSIILTFIYLFYKNYKTISTTESTNSLMSSILKTRKIVKYYVWYNLSVLVVSILVGAMIGFIYNPNVSELHNELTNNPKVLIVSILILLLITLALLGLLSLVYRLLYGRLLKRLLVNYSELKKIDF